MSVGILVCGDNHFIVRGPEPDFATALMLARRWSLIEIGASKVEGWSISSKEFRENLEWAIVVPGDGEMSPAVRVLPDEMKARGIEVRWLAASPKSGDERKRATGSSA